MTVHRGTIDALNRNFSSISASWEPASTGGVAGAASTQVSVSNFPAGALEATLLAIKAQTDKLTFDVLNALQITGLAIGASTTVNVSSLAGAVMVRSSAADHLGTVYQSTIGDLKATVAQNSSVWAIQADGRVRAQNSTIGDLLASVQQNSSVWQVQPGSTVFAKSAGFSVDSSNAQNVKLDGSTVLSVQQNSSLWQVQAGSTAFIKNAGLSVDSSNYQFVRWGSTASENAVRAVLSSTQADNVVTVTPTAGSTFAVRPLQSSAADLQVTATPVAGSTWAVRPLQSSASDLKVSAFLFDSTNNAIQSCTVAGSTFLSTGRGLMTRPCIPDCTSAVGSVANASTGDVSLISSAATTIYVYAYSISAESTANITVRLLSGSTNEVWRTLLESGSTGPLAAGTVDRDAMIIAPPAYLFRTAAANPLLYGKGASSAANGLTHSSFAFWRE